MINLNDENLIDETDLEFAVSSLLTGAIDLDCPKSSNAKMVTPCVLQVLLPAISGAVLGAGDDLSFDLYTGASASNVSTLLVSSIITADSDGTADIAEQRYSVLLPDLQDDIDQYIQVKGSSVYDGNLSSVLTVKLVF